MNIHTNDEIKLLWRMGDVALGNQFGSAVLECEVERIDPMDVAKKIVEWCKKNERFPKRKNIRKNNKDEFTQDEIDKSAMKLFHASITYLSVIFFAVGLDALILH
jgi:hypothetical protein